MPCSIFCWWKIKCKKSNPTCFFCTDIPSWEELYIQIYYIGSFWAEILCGSLCLFANSAISFWKVLLALIQILHPLYDWSCCPRLTIRTHSLFHYICMYTRTPMESVKFPPNSNCENIDSTCLEHLGKPQIIILIAQGCCKILYLTAYWYLMIVMRGANDG